jgi:hypothetical protein
MLEILSVSHPPCCMERRVRMTMWLKRGVFQQLSAYDMRDSSIHPTEYEGEAIARAHTSPLSIST